MDLELTEHMPDFRADHFYQTYFRIVKSYGMGVQTAYLMSLSALMLGCDVVFHRSNMVPKTRRIFPAEFSEPTYFSVRCGKSEVYFWENASDRTVTFAGALDSKDKGRAKPLLDHAGVRTPVGGVATARDLSILDKLAAAGVRDLILKPVGESQSRGILEHADIEQARGHILTHPQTAFLVEQFILGDTVRVQVVGDDAVAAVYLRPLCVIGDGKSSIRDLVQRLVRRRDTNPRARAVPLDLAKVAALLKARRIAPSAVLKSGALLPLTATTLQGSGGDSIWCLDHLTEEDRTLCIQAAKALGLKMAGVDLRKGLSGTSYVLELNAKPGFGFISLVNLGPWNLRAPEAVLRWHFPKLKDHPRRVARYDFLRLLDDYNANPDEARFDAGRYVEFAQ
jgi:cyanophycin synthetase